MHKHFLTILFLALQLSSLAQSTFKANLAFHPGEPNSAYKVIEHDNLFYVGGDYFDNEIGIWTAFYSVYDKQGNLVRILTEKNDTIPSNGSSRKIMKDSDGLNSLAFYNRNSKLYHYNFESDSAWVKSIVDVQRIHFLPLDAIFNESNNKYYFVGSNIESNNNRHVSVASVSDSIDSVFHDEPKLNFSDHGIGITLNSRDNVVVLGSRLYPSDRPESFVMIFDEALNLLHTTQDTEDQLDFDANRGFFVDSEDNILIPGAGLIDGEYSQLVVKLDSLGKTIWKEKLDYNHNNFSLAGQWRSVTEAHEKDGYIIAGSESYQDDEGGIDTFIVKAAIAKLSLDGDSVWYRTYSYRSGLRVSDAFYDIEPTSDGGYIAVGRSPILGIPTEEELPWVQSIIMKVDAEGRLDSLSKNHIALDKRESISVYPNPVDELLYLTQSSVDKLHISIYNNEGRLIESCNSENSSHTIIVDVGNYPRGIYNVVSKSDKGKVYTRRFVKK